MTSKPTNNAISISDAYRGPVTLTISVTAIGNGLASGILTVKFLGKSVKKTVTAGKVYNFYFDEVTTTGGVSANVTYSSSNNNLTGNLFAFSFYSHTVALGVPYLEHATEQGKKYVYEGQTCIGVGSDNPSQAIVIGANGVLYDYISKASSSWNNASDKRDKADFENITQSLNFINKLQPVTYVDNHRSKYRIGKDENEIDEESYKKQTKKGNRRIAGFVAQDIYQKLIDTYNTDNYASIVDYSKYDNPDTPVDRYYMCYSQLIPFLTGAIQELSQKLDAANSKIEELESKINKEE